MKTSEEHLQIGLCVYIRGEKVLRFCNGIFIWSGKQGRNGTCVYLTAVSSVWSNTVRNYTSKKRQRRVNRWESLCTAHGSPWRGARAPRHGAGPWQGPRALTFFILSSPWAPQASVAKLWLFILSRPWSPPGQGAPSSVHIIIAYLGEYTIWQTSTPMYSSGL